ncbi:hypothetical protein Sps_02707 [Shewanella psychrophila]|uniref:Uncharacterized protein n=1 Tax=Shewanella psychrophila TaxID=225848 RepID=A0A1S6HQR6_9GAMM|nr:hypothetical protein [Shewanella psychrophila]AQS37859.1 hypothetical protein Sps_02707 [Shewanella psychrophila]
MPIGKIVNVNELMLHDASSIESDISWISDNEWLELLPSGNSLSQIKYQLAAGELVLLSSSPRNPLFVLSEGEWITSASACMDFPIGATTAITQRFSSAGSSILFGRGGSESLPPSPPLDYKPDTSKVKEAVTPISYQYNIEIACTPQRLSALSYGYFMLAKTYNEPVLALSTAEAFGEHTLLSTLGRFDEAKRLQHILATGKSSQLSVQPVAMVPIGSQKVSESFIPVQLVIQVGARLGCPTKGFYYHFRHADLIHEYQIVDGSKGYFNITCSTASMLSDEIRFSELRGHIFLPWKVEGQAVAPQHIYYSQEKLTTEILQSIDKNWLNDNAFIIEPAPILAINQQMVIARNEAVKDKPPQPPQSVSRPENVYYSYPNRDILTGVLGISEQTLMPELAVLRVAEISLDQAGKLAAFCAGFNNIVFFVPNSPNYGEQGINLRAMLELSSYLPSKQVISIITDDDDFKPFHQEVRVILAVKEGHDVNNYLPEFYQVFADGGIIEGDEDQVHIIIPDSTSACFTNADELHEIFGTVTNDAIVIKGPSADNEKLEVPALVRGYDKELYSQKSEFTFTFEQKAPLTARGKLLKLCPNLLETGFEFSNMSDPWEGKTLLLTGARDSQGIMYPELQNITEVHMRDKDHQPEKRQIFIAGSEETYPENIEAKAIYRTLVNKASIDTSTQLAPTTRSNLALLAQEDIPLVYNYGFHQVSEESREELVQTQINALSGKNRQRPIIFIVGDYGIPAIEQHETIHISDAEIPKKLSSDLNTPLIVFAGKLPAEVNNYMISKSCLVLAEGKGTISLAQEFGVAYIILPQKINDKLTLKTDYHDKSLLLETISKNIYQPDVGAKGMSDIFNGKHEVEFKQMSSKQSLILETLSQLYER